MPVGIGVAIPLTAPVGSSTPGAGVDNLLLEDGSNFLLEDGSVLKLES